MAEKNYHPTVASPAEDVLVEIAARHVKKLARVIDDTDVRSPNHSGPPHLTWKNARKRNDFAHLVLKLPADGLGKEMLSQQMAEKSQIDGIIEG